MLVTTTDNLPGYEIRLVLGQVLGLSIQDAAFGGHSVPSALRKTQEALDLMVYEARRRGATAIVGMRFDNTQLNDFRIQICAYGTAVTVEPVTDDARRQFDDMARPVWPTQQQPPVPEPPPPPATLPG